MLLAGCDKPAQSNGSTSGSSGTGSTAVVKAAAIPAITVSGVARERFLPNPVNGGGAPVSVTPLVGRAVIVRQPDAPHQEVARTKTGAEGRFSIAVPPGTYEVLLERAGAGPAVVKKVVVDSNPPPDIVLETVIAQP